MTWEWYQKRIAEFFRQVSGARVHEDVKVVGKSGVKRQLDVQIFYPMQVELSKAIKVTVDIHIIVDAKKHERPVEIGMIGQIDDLREDVGAHLAIIASPHGFTSGAKARATQVNVIPLVVTSDLLGMLNKVGIPWAHECHSYLCDPGRGFVNWNIPPYEGQTVLGSCQHCDVMHVLCPECGFVFPVFEVDEEKPLRCPGGCDRIYRAKRDQFHHATVEVRDQLDVLLMSAAYDNKSKRIASSKVAKLIGTTKWQYFKEPAIHLTETGLMEWSEDGEYLCLTESGQHDYETFILSAEEASE